MEKEVFIETFCFIYFYYFYLFTFLLIFFYFYCLILSWLELFTNLLYVFTFPLFALVYRSSYSFMFQSLTRSGQSVTSNGRQALCVRRTYRPLGVQQDVGELQHQRVRRLVVRLFEGVGKQLGARGLDDHLKTHKTRSGSRSVQTNDRHPPTGCTTPSRVWGGSGRVWENTGSSGSERENPAYTFYT